MVQPGSLARVRRGGALALLIACGEGCTGASAGRTPTPPPSPLFIEAAPQRYSAELFSALRSLAVEVDIGPDARLWVRMHEADNFATACRLLGQLHHELAFVDLSWLPISDFGPIFQLRSVERLDLRGTAMVDLTLLRHLGALRVLSLAETDIDSLTPLAELRTLESLDLSDARVDLRDLAAMASLRELDLSTARTTPRGFEVRDGEGLDLEGLRPLESLESLRLTATKVHDWRPLRRLSTLRRLELSYTNFQDPALLSDYADLEALDLRRTAIADPWPLLELDSLRFLDLRDCELLDPRDVQAFAALRRDVQILY
ncbi:MAG: hypothetical protein KC431_29425 [Myxococcales bacterium]|nr:hypothetical protein [Myxococcales bacterium]